MRERDAAKLCRFVPAAFSYRKSEKPFLTSPSAYANPHDSLQRLSSRKPNANPAIVGSCSERRGGGQSDRSFSPETNGFPASKYLSGLSAAFTIPMRGVRMTRSAR